jgi:hypothetical protein
MTRTLILLIVAALLTILACKAPADPPDDNTTAPSHPKPLIISCGPVDLDIDLIQGSYQRSLKLMTPRPVMTNLELATLCRGTTQWDVEKAQKTLGLHAYATINIYMNDLAAGVFTKHQAATTQPTTQPAGPVVYPVGAVIVKEKHRQGYFKEGLQRESATTLDGIGGMIKRPPGYNPDHGDWEYFFGEEKKPIEAGRMDSCVKCHAGAAATDHVFGSWAQGS